MSQSVKKQLILGVMRTECIDGAICANDTTGCYDRIIHTAGSLATQQAGVPENACKCMFSCLQYMKHFVSTAYGTSSNSLSPTTSLPIPESDKATELDPVYEH